MQPNTLNSRISVLALALTVAVAVDARAQLFVRGDVNFDGQVSLTDVVQVFETTAFGAPTFPCFDALDVDDDGSFPVNGLEDAFKLWNWLFRLGPAPSAPFPKSGADPTTNDNYGCAAGAIKPPLPANPGYAFALDAPRYVRRGSQGVEVYLRATTQAPVGAFSLAYKLRKKLVANVEADFAGTVLPKIERQYIEGSGAFRLERIVLPNDPEFDLLLVAAIFIKAGPSLNGVDSPFLRIPFAATQGALDNQRLLRLVVSIRADAPLGTTQTALEPAGATFLLPGNGSVLHGLRNEFSQIDPKFISPAIVPLTIGMWRPIAWDAGEFFRGDANGDRCRDLSDPVHTLSFLFLGRSRSLCPDAADANDDGRLDISDSIFMLAYLFSGGPPPPYVPFIGPDACWFDETDDALGECNYECAECPR